MQNLVQMPQSQNLSSFRLITKFIDKGYQLGLSTLAHHTMLVLLRFYNPAKKIVFPHQETISKLGNMSLSSTKRALTELIKQNLIIKTRTRNGNIYGFTNKLFELLNDSNMAFETAQPEPCMNIEHENLKDKLTDKKNEIQKPKPIKNEVVTFSDLEILKHLKQNKTISNPLAYLNWLNKNQDKKASFIESLKEKRTKEINHKAFLKEQEENLKTWGSYYKPDNLKMSDKMSKDSAISFINMKIKFKYHSFNRAVELDENIKSLVKKYNFNEADLNK